MDAFVLIPTTTPIIPLFQRLPTPMMMNGENTTTVLTYNSPSNFIHYDTAETLRNESRVMEECGNLVWVRSLDLFLGLTYLSLSMLGICENVYAFYQIYQTTTKFKMNQSRASFFILVGNLAAGDIMILTLPVWVTIHGMFRGREILPNPGDFFTVVVVFVHSCCARISIIFIMFIAVFRVFSVRCPLQIGRIFSILRTVIVSALSWLLVVVLSVYSFDGRRRNAVYKRSAGLCMVSLNDKDNESLSVAGQILAPFLVPGFITFLALCYLLIFLGRMYSSKRNKLKGNQSSYRPARERDSLLMTLKLITCFVLTYTPWYVDGTLEFLKNPKDKKATSLAYAVHDSLTYGNCFGGMFWHNLCLGGFLFVGAAANPFLYGQTLVHTSQQNTQRGLAQALATLFVTYYRRMKRTNTEEDNEDEEPGNKRTDQGNALLHATVGLPGFRSTGHIGAIGLKSNSDKDSQESYEMGKYSLMSDHQDSTVHLHPTSTHFERKRRTSR